MVAAEANFVIKRHPNRRPFGHSTLRYGDKLVASLSVQIFMLASVPPLQFLQELLILPRKGVLFCYLLGCFFFERAGPVDCGRTHFNVPLGTILSMYGPFFGSQRRALIYTTQDAKPSCWYSPFAVGCASRQKIRQPTNQMVLARMS